MKVLGVGPGRLVGAQNGLEMRLHEPTEVGEMRQVPLTPEELSAEFLLKALDCLGERRLRDVAQLGRPREVQRLADGEEVADLMHLHRSSSIHVVSHSFESVATITHGYSTHS